MPEHEETRIEFLIIADRAEISGGKLYMMGGCWDRITVPQIHAEAGVSLGVALRVWIAPERSPVQHRIKLSLRGPGHPTIVPDEFGFVRNPETAEAIGSLPVLVAAECFITVATAGSYVLEASLDGIAGASTSFAVFESNPSSLQRDAG